MTKKGKPKQKTRDSITLAEGHVERARQELLSAEQDLNNYHHAKSVHSSQVCIELSMKAIYRYFGEAFTPSHELKVDEFVRVLDQIPEDLKYHKYSRLFILANFWTEFYTISKYGHEKIGISSEQIFEKDEAELALKHANACYHAANAIRIWLITKGT